MNIKLKIDKAVYEYSYMKWYNLTGLTPENIVSTLSAGKGIVPSYDTDAIKAIDALLKRVDKFVPRVRIEGDESARYGADCRTFIASWRRRLTNIRTGIKRKSNIVYLTDAVNNIIVKPFNDEIANLRESVKEELSAEKGHKTLTPEQTQRLTLAKEAIAKQNELKRKAPRCTNGILTTILHESIDNIPSYDAKVINDLDQRRNEVEKLIKEKSAAKTTIESEVQLIHSIREKRFRIIRKYYSCLSPQTVADTLIRCDGTFWGEIPIMQTFKEVKVKMTSKKKPAKAAVPAGDVSQEQQPVDAAKPKSRPRRKQTQAEVAEAMMLFPYSVGSAQTDSELESKIAADNRVFDEYDSFVRGFTGKSFNEEYRAKYEDCRRRFRTAPKLFSTFNDGAKKDAAPQQIGTSSSSTANQKQENMRRLMTLLNDLAKNTPYLAGNLKEEKNKDYIESFAYREDFQTIYNVLSEKSRLSVTANDIMGYIRNVVLRNNIKWTE